MNTKEIFQILGICETTDADAIKAAYINKLKENHPEENPDGFMLLRKAYDAAVKLSKNQNQSLPLPEPMETSVPTKTNIDLWIDRIDQMYQDIYKRCDTSVWRQILDDPVCDGLDTCEAARDALLSWMMEHIYFPKEIYRLINSKFQILGKYNELVEFFPQEFLKYVEYNVQHPSIINYKLFKTINHSHYYADSYIYQYLYIKNQIDHEQLSDLYAAIKSLSSRGLYHPYEDVEYIRLLLKDNSVDKAIEIAERLLDTYKNDPYIQYWSGAAFSHGGYKELAADLWKQIIKETPEHYLAGYALLQHFKEKGNFEEARDIILNLLKYFGSNETLHSELKAVNAALIETCKQQIVSLYNDSGILLDTVLKLGWLLYQNEQYHEAIELLESYSCDAEHEYTWTELLAYVYYHANMYSEASTYLKQFLRILQLHPITSSSERRYQESQIHYYLSHCSYETGEPDTALAFIQLAYANAQTQHEKSVCLEYQAFLLFNQKKYKECIGICDQLLLDNRNHFPAYLQRMEAALKLNKAKMVIDDYSSAIRLNPYHARPYQLTARILLKYEQYEKVLQVLDRAKTNQVPFTTIMTLCEFQSLRKESDSAAHINHLLYLCKDLLPFADQTLDDLENPGEIIYALTVFYLEFDASDDVPEHANAVLQQIESHRYFHYTCGTIFQKNKQFEQALKEYLLAESSYADPIDFDYRIASCYAELDLYDNAITHFERVLERNLNYKEVLYNLRRQYLKKYGKTRSRILIQKSIATINLSILYGRSNAYYLLVERAELYLREYDFVSAIADYKYASTLREQNWMAYYGLGQSFSLMGLHEKAIQYFEMAGRKMPSGSVQHILELAKCYEQISDFEKSIDHYFNFVTMYPRFQWANTEIGLLHSYLGNLDQALLYFNKDISNENYLKNIARIHFQKGSHSVALSVLEDGLNNAESPAIKVSILVQKADFYCFLLKDYMSACSCLEKAISLCSDEEKLFEYAWKLSICYFCSKNFGNAKTLAEKALYHFSRLEIGTEQDYISVKEFRSHRLLRLGWCYISLGQVKKGLKMLHEMTGCTKCSQCRTKKCYERFLYEGLYYEATGDFPNALKFYERGLEIAPHILELQVAYQAISHYIHILNNKEA